MSGRQASLVCRRGQAKTAGVPGRDGTGSNLWLCWCVWNRPDPVLPGLPPEKGCPSAPLSAACVLRHSSMGGRVQSGLSSSWSCWLQAGRQAGLLLLGMQAAALHSWTGAHQAQAGQRPVQSSPLPARCGWEGWVAPVAGSGSACCCGVKPHPPVGSGVSTGLFINPVKPTPLLAGGPLCHLYRLSQQARTTVFHPPIGRQQQHLTTTSNHLSNLHLFPPRFFHGSSSSTPRHSFTPLNLSP
ncbi:uncharacterized protein F5Z01DRAFT_139331 [Emericellopsis atlantica]|uniref:Uncharacterized protein n=1 Tax=Emericellopsis atlantica TaxID=2614577 RepID=A0A9P7ZKN6_9HYPO|nr:uncharacterized protein F5Z01DRAFT_139331 [Emericellopsis atlantica]KAG9253442.1 hypothetical protein F5Z01DRAFT_139331 [Emericellopsis atlantica]